METGTLSLSALDETSVPLVVGLLLLHLKFQTEPLLASSAYEKCCKIIVEVKGSTALGAAFLHLIETELHPKRQDCAKAFFKYLWLLQSQKALNGLDSIALATRFGNFLLRPPSGQEPSLPRVKLMGALAVLIESFPRPGAPAKLAGSPSNSPPGSARKASAGNTAVATVAVPIATRPGPSASIAGVQVSEVARSAVVVIDSSQKTLAKIKAGLAKETDAAKLMELVKRLKHLEQVVAGQQGASRVSLPGEYAI